MGKRLLLSLRDRKTESYFPGVFTAVTRGEAERNFLDILRSTGTVVSQHPEDFALYEIGMFEDSSGEVFPVMEGNKVLLPRLLADGGELLKLVKEA